MCHMFSLTCEWYEYDHSHMCNMLSPMTHVTRMTRFQNFVICVIGTESYMSYVKVIYFTCCILDLVICIIYVSYVVSNR